MEPKATQSGRFSAQGTVSTMWGEVFSPVTLKRYLMACWYREFDPLPSGFQRNLIQNGPKRKRQFFVVP